MVIKLLHICQDVIHLVAAEFMSLVGCVLHLGTVALDVAFFVPRKENVKSPIGISLCSLNIFIFLWNMRQSSQNLF